ncbi:hypothetical protein GS534_24130 [Rhodococcus hoagii]|nr:hypothetical protein [Prescottella equi]MBM4613726.1 hypothetical protein [Prescottella equi]MBM4613731.1 hypothetical protein [Prescottella equi]MBM4618001.1 hypothetical protein [Prescottella equi]NKS33118.1 hypothetical protein [Prescottella equi]
MAQQEQGVRVVREAFWHHMNGYPELVTARTTVRVGHPLIKKFGDFFYPPGFVDIDTK